MALFVAFSIAIAIICVLMTALRKNGYLLSYIRWGGIISDDKQPFRHYTAKKVLSLLKTNKLFPICPSQGWLLSSLHHGHRVWSTVIPTGTATHSLTLYSAYAKVQASSQVILQLLKDVAKVGEWCPRVISCAQLTPTQEDDSGRRKPYPSLPVQHDQVKEVVRTDDRLLEGRRELVLKRIWHREDNGCCWMLKMCELTGSWVFFLAQPVEDVEHSLLTVISPELSPGGDVAMDVASLLGCLENHLFYRKAQFTPLLSITVPPSHVLDPDINVSSDEEPVCINNNPPKEDNSSSDGISRKSANRLAAQPKGHTANVREVSKGDKQTRSANDITAASVSILRPGGRQVSKSISYVMKFEKAGESSVSSSEDYQCSMSHANLASVGPDQSEEGACTAMPIRRVESDSSLFMKPKSMDDASLNAQPAKCDEDRQRTKMLILANQGAAELLVQSFKASSVDVRQIDTGTKTWENCPGGWMFSGLDRDVVILKRLFKTGMSTQSYLGKGVIQASPKAVFDAIRNPRMKFTYDESLKIMMTVLMKTRDHFCLAWRFDPSSTLTFLGKVDILQTVSDTIKIVYFYHEILQLFRKDACDFCVLQSERVDGDKFVLSLQSVDAPASPKQSGVLRGKLLPSGWIIEPVREKNKVISMVTFLMQMDMGPGKGGSSLPFEDVASRQPLAIVQLREYFKPLSKLMELAQTQ